jgi:8-oxo-dGTP diphosphatase
VARSSRGRTRRSPPSARSVLRAATARLVAGDPVPSEHDAVRWLGPDQLHEVAWVAADVPFVAALREQLGARR